MKKSKSSVKQFCGGTKNNRVYILYREKLYKIWMVNKECLNHPVGSKLELIYNSQWDYFYRPDGLKGDIRRLYLFSILFILSIIPYKIYISVLTKFKAAN